MGATLYQSLGETQSRRSKGLNIEDHRPNQVQGTLSKSKVVNLQNYQKILHDFQASTTSPNDQVNRAPIGSISTEHLNAGLHFSLHPFIVKIFNLYKVIPMQPTPNTFRIICSFIVLYHDHGIELKTSLFYSFFMIRRHPYNRGWWFIGSRYDQKFIKGLSIAIHDWKPYFFFCLLLSLGASALNEENLVLHQMVVKTSLQLTKKTTKSSQGLNILQRRSC